MKSSAGSQYKKALGTTLIIKIALGVILLLMISIGGYKIIAYGKNLAGGLAGRQFDYCPQDNTEPLQCYCGSIVINQNLGKSGFDPDTAQYCCGGAILEKPCVCKGIERCEDYNTKITKISERKKYCVEETLCTRKIGDGRTRCEWAPLTQGGISGCKTAQS